MLHTFQIRAAHLGLSLLVLGVTASSLKAQEKLDFNRDVRPILSENCFKCHGFDNKNRAAGLRLDLREGATVKLESGAVAVVAGDLATSELIKRVEHTDANEVMPPPATGKKLTPAQIETLKRWIQEGAEFKQHWSFIPPTRPAVPQAKNAAWVKNPIDAYILARLEREGLTPSAVADKVTLIRRVTLDLTGLPPTIAEVDAFLADESPNAYETLVDRLLKSPRFGEHAARYWLDAARYGDTHGLHLDNERSIWPYRDWVVRSFNQNLPFNQFALEQIAGDLLPNATLDQKVATGFSRCNVSTSEGGSIDEEVLVRYAVDRTETLSTVFLGMTLGCAVCHDHKFDPVTQKEFYQLYAFFNNVADRAMDGNALSPPPIMKLTPAETQARLADLDQKIAAANTEIAAQLAKVSYTDPNPYVTPESQQPQEFVWIEDDTPAGAQQQGTTPWQFVKKEEGPVFSGERSTVRTGEGVTQHFFTGATAPLKVGEGDKFFAYVYLDPQNPPKAIMLQFNDGTWEHRAEWGDQSIGFGTLGTPGRVAMGPLPKLGEWVRLEVEAAKVGLAPGASINGWAYTQSSGKVYWDKSGIISRTVQPGQSYKSLAQWEANEKLLAKPSAPAPVVEAIKVETAKRTDAQSKLIRDYFLEHVYSETRSIFDPLHKQVADFTKQRADTDNSIPTSLVMADNPPGRETFILTRGAYDKPGEKVAPGVPAIFPALPEGAPVNRLGLAQWLTSPQHPLVARVTVNRYWQQFFGIGIVKTAEDFGSQGSWPTNPELLDWLAVEFVESGWNIKHLQKLILMSATYQQSSKVTPELHARDPENLLLARGARFRLDAEVIRDSALFDSGLLVEKQGGRGVRPYQPEGIWEAISFQGSTTQNYKPDSGESLYRRSLYTFWKRTAPPPSLATFDAPSREACVVRRGRTNTPLQALALMNDQQYVEAARKLAERMMLEGGTEPAARLTFAFRLATSRAPRDPEKAILLRLLDQHQKDFQADVPAAEKLLTIGEAKRNETLPPAELAAYTMVANLILNLDEVVTKE